MKLGFSLSYQFIFSDCLTDFPRTGNIFTVFCGCSKPIKICYNCLKGVSSIVINYRFFILYSGGFPHFHRSVFPTQFSIYFHSILCVKSVKDSCLYYILWRVIIPQTVSIGMRYGG